MGWVCACCWPPTSLNIGAASARGSSVIVDGFWAKYLSEFLVSLDLMCVQKTNKE